MRVTITRRSKRETETLIARLEGDYGEFPVVEKTWEHSPTAYRTVLDRYRAGALGGAGVWLTNDEGAVLLVRNEGDDGWTDPGGKIEPNESVETAAKREVREETGVECRLTGVCDVHVVRNRDETEDRPDAFETIVIFRGEYVAGDPRPREGEIAEIGWFTSPPSSVLYEEVRTRPYSGRL